jgi:hypothetical protein
MTTEMIERVHHGDLMLALIVRADFKRSGIEFFTPNEFSQQLGYMNRAQGYVIPPHVHNPAVREVQYTKEVLFIRSGRLRVDFYSEAQEYLESRILAAGDVILLAFGGHGFEMLEDTEMIEVKQGPYAGEQDKTRFAAVDHARRPCGSFGDVSIFSFYPNKHITTGEGGMIVTDDDALAARCSGLRNLCFKKERRFVHDELGWNFRMTNLQAALGVAQLERLDEFVLRKRRMGHLYTELLGDVPGIRLPLAATEYAENIYWVYGIVLEEGVAEDVTARLGARGIGTRPFFWCMHEQPVFRKMGWYENESHPVAEAMARRGFYVPSGLALTEEQIRTVAAEVRAACR